ncbi:MAG: universal stress protein, partial [Candidatus Binatia bacterium]
GLAAARRTAEAAATRLRAAFPGWAVTAQVEADAPAWGIVKLADRWRPDLIVVGAHEQSALERLLLGSTSLAVLTHASASVRIARPPATAADGPARLLVGIDGSAGADAAVAAVAARHWAPPAEVRVVAALDPTLTASLEQFATTDAAAASQALVDRAAAVLRAAGLTVSTAVVDGAAKQVLLDEAQHWRADGIFVGARGLRATERFLLGSVSSTVAARAECSVEVVRAAG